jgi:hypothetical protein
LRQQSALALKGAPIEEWTDVHFFRPVGIRIARALEPTGVSADQVTLWSLAVGLVAGHLVVYSSLALNLVGVALFIVSDLFDSADGQLARLRGTSTRLGRVLDGLSDMVRFLNLYLHLLVRIVVGQGWGWPAGALVLVVIWSHSFQGASVDFIKNVFLEIGPGDGGETDLPEDLEPGRGAGLFARVAARLYRAYSRRQAMMFPLTYRLLQADRRSPLDGTFRERYAERQAPLLPVLTLIATNIRFALLTAAIVLGHVWWFLFVTAVPMNLVMAAVILAHERNTAVLVRGIAGSARVPVGAD